jgi:hypothetical protein
MPDRRFLGNATGEQRMQTGTAVSRRTVLGAIAAGAAAAMLRPFGALAQATPLTKPIPSSGERLPVVGLGSWITAG